MSSPAESYEEYMVPAYFAPLTAQLLARARPQPGERVLDVACGTGIAARRIAPLVGSAGSVAGLDMNPAMLEVARRKSRQEGQAINWHEGRAEALPFPDESFDLVVCQHGLQYMPDRQAAVGEMRRVLRSGGRLMVSTTGQLANAAFERQVNALMEERFGVSPYRQVYSLDDSSVLRDLLETTGLREVAIELVTVDARYPDPERFVAMRIMVLLAAVPQLQQLMTEESRAMAAELREAVMPLVREYVVGEEVVMPAEAQIASGIR